MNMLNPSRRDPIELLYQSHARSVYSLSLRLLDDVSAAESVTATAFLKLARLLYQQPTPANVEQLLMRITVDLLLEHFGRNIPTPHQLEATDWEEPHEPLGLQTVNGPALESAIRKLPLNLRFAFVLHDVHRFSNEDISSMLGWTLSLTKAALFNARLELRQLLLDESRIGPSLADSRRKKTG
jgi:RNA polymerase sigma-70 factor (ECF subfamily)